MKTIYECSQSKVIKWFTAIFFLIIIGSVLLVIYQASRGMDPTQPILVTALLLIVSIICLTVIAGVLVIVFMNKSNKPGYRVSADTVTSTSATVVWDLEKHVVPAHKVLLL